MKSSYRSNHKRPNGLQGTKQTTNVAKPLQDWVGMPVDHGQILTLTDDEGTILVNVVRLGLSGPLIKHAWEVLTKFYVWALSIRKLAPLNEVDFILDFCFWCQDNLIARQSRIESYSTHFGTFKKTLWTEFIRLKLLLIVVNAHVKHVKILESLLLLSIDAHRLVFIMIGTYGCLSDMTRKSQYG